MPSPRNTPDPYRYLGTYGPKYREGVLSDHLCWAQQAGATTRLTASGRHRVVFPDGSTAQVLCSEIVRIPTEDGPIDGRCGSPVAAGEGHYCCDAHSWVEQQNSHPLGSRLDRQDADR